MEHYSYKSECGICALRHLKEELAWAIDKQFHFVDNNTAKDQRITYVVLCGP